MHDVARPLRRVAKVKSTRKIVIKALSAVGVLFLIIFGIKALQIVKMATTKQPIPVATVTSAPVKEEDWAPVLSAVGSVRPCKVRRFRPNLAGLLARSCFKTEASLKKET